MNNVIPSKAEQTEKENVKPGKSLSQRVVRGGIWVFTLRITQGVFGLIRIIVLARILSPKEFGLMGIALLTMATLETFSQTGFQQALIQKKENTDAYLDSAWTVLILRGFILFTILFFIAPYAATFFDAPEASPIIQVIGFSVLLQAFTNIGVIYFQKELEFNKQFVYELTGILADFIVAVFTALILRNVWALVFGLLAGNAMRCFVSYLIHPHRPHLTSDLGKAKDLWSFFGKWMLGSSTLIFLIIQGDDIFVGKLLGATALGFYQMAYRISNMPATEITHVISQVTFPAYSKLQDDLSKLREAYLKVLQLTTLLSFPVAGLIFVLAPDFTVIFLGEKWMPMVPAMQVLCIFGVMRSIAAIGGPIILALGRPVIQTVMSFFQLIILVGIIYPLTIKFGIWGTSIATIIAFTTIFIPGQIIICKLINLRFLDWARSLIPALIGSIITIGIILLIKPYLGKVSPIILIALIMLATFVYFAWMLLLWKDRFVKPKGIFSKVR